MTHDEHARGGALNDEQRGGHTDPVIANLRSLIGQRVRVISAPSGNSVGFDVVLLEPGDWHQWTTTPVVCFERRDGGTLATIPVMPHQVDQWKFEVVPPRFIEDAALDAQLTDAELAAGVDTRVAMRRAREVYDHEAFVSDVDAAVKEIRDLLVQKNQAYGNSALDPVRIFSKADAMEQLFVRIDDKLSRLKRGHAAGEDVVKDLQGYLLLVRVAQLRAARVK